MKPHYFEQDAADKDDFQLGMAKMQGYVPQGCLLGGVVVMSEVTAGRSACAGCEGPRGKCGGKPKVSNVQSDRRSATTDATKGEEG